MGISNMSWKSCFSRQMFSLESSESSQKNWNPHDKGGRKLSIYESALICILMLENYLNGFGKRADLSKLALTSART